jgi:hypothetical protein
VEPTSPPALIVRRLAAQRRDGAQFPAAWENATAALPPGNGREARAWQEAVTWARPAYRRAYDREPPTHAERAVSALPAELLAFGQEADHVFDPSSVRRRALAAWKAENDRRVQRDVENAEPLNPISLHEARHTCASVFIASGANPKAIQTIMGHATIQMTFDQYGHLMPGGLEEAAAAADAYLAEPRTAKG